MSRSWLVGGGVALAVVVAVAIVLLARGGDSESSAPAPGAVPGQLSEEQQAQVEQFQACLSEQGIEMPQPGEAPSATALPSVDLQRALQECQQYMPEGIGPGGAPGEFGAPIQPPS